jgi:hypothetical protein
MKEETNNRGLMYSASNSRYPGNETYPRELREPSQPKEQGEWNDDMICAPTGDLMAIDVGDSTRETLGVIINHRTGVDFSEQLKRSCTGLNSIKEFFAGNYGMFQGPSCSFDLIPKSEE